MRVAILLTGIDEVFPKIKNRLLDSFQCKGIEFDFFGHTWEEKVAELNPTNDKWSDISDKFVKKNIPFPYNDDRIKNYKSSSYQEIYDKYISMDGISQIVIQNKMIFFMSYLSQSLSTYYAFKALEEYKTQNEIEYDMVFKWRWDLIFDPNEKHKLNRLKNCTNNTIYSPLVDSNQMSDFWWGGDYDTLDVIINDLPHHMAFSISNALSVSTNSKPKNPYHFYHERMLLETILTIAKEKKLILNFTDRQGFPGTTVFRPELNGDEDYWQIFDYNKTKWINQGWESRNVKND